MTGSQVSRILYSHLLIMLRLISPILVFAMTAALLADDPPVVAEPTTQNVDENEDQIADQSTDQNATTESAVATPDQTPVRAIVVVDRYTKIEGTIEVATSDVVVIRKVDGTVQSFARASISRLILLTDPLPGQHGTVYMLDGEQRYGVILRDTFKEVVVEIEGVLVRLPRAAVVDVQLEPTFTELEAHYRATLDLSIPEVWLGFCQWLVDERSWQLAVTELDALWKVSATGEVLRLRRLASAQLALITGRAERRANGAGSESSRPTRQEKTFPLTESEVNLIRVYEIDFRDPPKIVVTRPTIRRILDEYAGNELIPTDPDRQMALYAARPVDLVRLIFQLRARDLYDEIEVLTEPPALELFRRRVHDTWLIQNCATSECHGGPNAGRFALWNEDYRDERVRYANLLALEQLPMTMATPLIDFQIPEQSLLVQHALPREHARQPHPDVLGWRPAFRGPRDRRYLDTMKWIRSMFKPRPTYPVTFVPKAIAPESPSGDR